MRRRPATTRDADDEALRAASRAVGLQLAAAATAIVLVVLVAAFAFVLSHVEDGGGDHESMIDVGVVDLLTGGAAIGGAAIVIAGVLSWFATRRAVRPLGDALRMQRAFVANAAHELRTPVTVLDARLQYLERHLPVEDPEAETVRLLRGDTAVLARIVDDLLRSAEQEGSRTGPPALVLPVVELAVESMRLVASQRAIRIELVVEDEASGAASTMPSASVLRCLTALLDNAVKYSPGGSTVIVRVAAGADVVVFVRDSGPGITGIRDEDVFDRFARGDDSPHLPGGTGIGLSLVRQTMEHSGGSVIIESSGPAGTEMRLRLPRSSPGSPRRTRRPTIDDRRAGAAGSRTL